MGNIELSRGSCLLSTPLFVVGCLSTDRHALLRRKAPNPGIYIIDVDVLDLQAGMIDYA